MQRILWFSSATLLMLIAAACATSVPTASPALVAAPTFSSTHPPLGSVPAKASNKHSALTGATGIPVNVTLADNQISASLLTFKVGVPYTFVIRNEGPQDACFSIAEPAAVTGSLAASAANALVALNKYDLPPGHEAKAKYTFPGSAAGLPLEFSCLMRRQYDEGMRLAITVTK